MDIVLTLEDFKDNGYITKEVYPRIFLIENFLSSAEVTFLIDIANSATQENWEKEYVRNMKEFCTKKFGRDDFENLVKEGKLEVTYNWQDKVMIPETFDYKKFSDSFLSRIGLLFKDLKDFVVSGRSSIQRLYSGSELKAHADQDTDPSLAFGVVAYLNEDYNGGELYFPNLGFQIKPPTGSLIIFPSTKQYTHGVKHVEDGPTRYVIPTFIEKFNFYKDNWY